MMEKYFIKEYNTDMTLIELRICMFLCCQERIDKITEIMNYLNSNNFLVNLTMLYSDKIRAENIDEINDIPSLTIDTRDDKFRFKYWNGAEVFWAFHTQDLFELLISGRSNFEDLVHKYKPITDVIVSVQQEYHNSIRSVTYTYYPDDEIEIIYHLRFSRVVEDQKIENKFIKKIYDEINLLDIDGLADDMKFSIDFDFQDISGCYACEESKIEREKNGIEEENQKDSL